MPPPVEWWAIRCSMRISVTTNVHSQHHHLPTILQPPQEILRFMLAPVPMTIDLKIQTRQHKLNNSFQYYSNYILNHNILASPLHKQNDSCRNSKIHAILMCLDSQLAPKYDLLHLFSNQRIPKIILLHNRLPSSWPTPPSHTKLYETHKTL